MKVTIDRAGRVVVPKPLRDALGLAPHTVLEIEAIDGRLEITPDAPPAEIVTGPNGPVVAAAGRAVTDESVRALLEATRDRR
jgi:AbrB family looped-hinge helix DNA binding protein